MLYGERGLVVRARLYDCRISFCICPLSRAQGHSYMVRWRWKDQAGCEGVEGMSRLEPVLMRGCDVCACVCVCKRETERDIGGGEGGGVLSLDLVWIES